MVAFAISMHFVYLLHSEKCDRYYIGFFTTRQYTDIRHNAGMVAATKNCKPYQIKAIKSFPTKIEARREELRLKKQKSRKYLEWLVNGNWKTRPDYNRDDPQRSYSDSIGVRGTD